MRSTPFYLVVCAGLLCWSGCANDDPAEPSRTVPSFAFEGVVWPEIITPFSSDCSDLTMLFVDSQLDSQTVVTDAQGRFAVEVARGPLRISMFSDEIAFSGLPTSEELPRYLPRDTLVIVTQDTMMTLRCRMLGAIFIGGGGSTADWQWQYGVSNDGEKFIFNYDVRGSDMSMVNRYAVPHNAVRVGFALLGEAAPTGASKLWARVFRNDGLLAPDYFEVFDGEPRWWIRSLDSSLIGNDIRLALEYELMQAQYIYMHFVFIWVY